MTVHQSLHILQHALGLDEFGRAEDLCRSEARRNHYVAEKGGREWDLLQEHVAAGRMAQHEPRAIFGGRDSYCFTVTDAGREYVRTNSPTPPKLTRGQKRYDHWLDLRDVYPDLTFGDFLRRGEPALDHSLLESGDGAYDMEGA